MKVFPLYLMLYVLVCWSFSSAQTLASSNGVLDSSQLESPYVFSDFESQLHSSYLPLSDEPALQGAPYYLLDITIYPSLDKIEGEQTLYYTNRTGEFLQDIGILFLPNAAGAVMNVYAEDDPQVAAWQSDSASSHALRVALVEPLAPDAQISLTFYFSLSVPHSVNEGYGLIALQKGILSLAHSYGMVAAYDGDWQLEAPELYGDMTHNDMAFYDVTLHIPENLTVVTTGEIIQKPESVQKPESGKKPEVLQESLESTDNVLAIRAGPVRDFFISASYDYDVVERDTGAWKVRSFYLNNRGEADRERALQALAYSVDALEFFSEQLSPYPYREFDLVPLPTRALGMEFPGVVALTDSLYTDAGSVQGASTRTRLANTVVHEVAHQWFYNLVGNDQVGEPWLDEAPTQYITLLYHQAKHPDDYPYYYNELNGRAANRVRLVDQPVRSYTYNDYVQTIYGIAPMRLVHMAELLGESTFREFLRAYVQEYRWKRVRQQDFFDVLARYDGIGLLEAEIDPWFE